MPGNAKAGLRSRCCRPALSPLPNPAGLPQCGGGQGGDPGHHCGRRQPGAPCGAWLAGWLQAESCAGAVLRPAAASLPECLCRPMPAHPQFVPLMGFECRGLEPVSYQPGVFIVKSKGGATFEADLSEGCAAWAGGWWAGVVGARVGGWPVAQWRARPVGSHRTRYRCLRPALPTHLAAASGRTLTRSWGRACRSWGSAASSARTKASDGSPSLSLCWLPRPLSAPPSS